jgi:capsular polysaccharide biosynthesis protein
VRPLERGVGALELEFTRLLHEAEAVRVRHGRVATESFRAEAATRSQIAGHSRVVILDQAFLPPTPIRPRSTIYKLGLPVALLFALALLALRALFDDRIYDVNDLTHLGYDPILTVIPGPRSTSRG